MKTHQHEVPLDALDRRHPARAARQARSLSMARLSELSGVSAQTILHVENWHHRFAPRDATLERLAAALDVPVSQLHVRPRG
jgi:transcriptional regulator with XRE-family HTH domain